MVNLKPRRWLILIFALYFLLAVGYSLLMPIWEAPDEPAHYHLAWHLAHYGEYATQEVNYEANQPACILLSWLMDHLRALDKVDPELTRYRPSKGIYLQHPQARAPDSNGRIKIIVSMGSLYAALGEYNRLAALPCG